jgi:8-oxo-dGTP pyrophosphatase MutT (NUDIX family)
MPGGTLELDESPAEAARRELAEELGLTVPIGALLCVDWVPPSPPWDGGLMFVFDGGVLDANKIAAIKLNGDELDRIEFLEPSRLDDLLIPRLARRVSVAIGALGGGGVYLEDGSLAVSA